MKISWKQIATGMLAVMMLVLVGCGGTKDDTHAAAPGKLKVVATTTMLADLSRQIGGDAVEVTGLMGPGVDPHLYQASAGDVKVMSDADVVVYNGLHLEGKMGEIFSKLEQDKKATICVANNLDPSTLLQYEDDDGVQATDPHIWFDVKNWMLAAEEVYKGLAAKDPAHKNLYKANYEKYLAELKRADEYVAKRAAEIPQERRVLVTAHDAFQYFARAYGFTVKGLQGVSTEAEAGAIDVRELSDFIVTHQIRSIFVESSVPHKTIEAVQEACKAKGWDVKIGGELYSDSCGATGTPGGDYIGMVKENIDTIVAGLK